MGAPAQLWLIRHGETAWSAAGRHTGLTDIPLTPRGREQASALRERLAEHVFAAVLTSPLRRARDTCILAGFGDVAVVEPALREWDYGVHEGLTTAEIRQKWPEWEIWTDTPVNGERAKQVGVRADHVITRATAFEGGDVALFAHGHLLRVLAARWLGRPATDGRDLALDAASISVLGYERENRVLRLWNDQMATREPTSPAGSGGIPT